MAIGKTVNGFDREGYFARTHAIVTTCATYALRETPTCGGTFKQPPSRRRALADYLLGDDR